MTRTELLNWLAVEDRSALGECSGALLDQLVAEGLAEIGRAPFGLPDHAPVSLTEAGWQAVRAKEN
ncbi:hypothetical protein NKG99_20555 [Mesorhizobium sp. M1409]|uniref:hypothetical protein n=1 Tax=Mesorhizobium sp. M1409 TaxID=2957100 RepID=UPI003336A876